VSILWRAAIAARAVLAGSLHRVEDLEDAEKELDGG
jgi:hypothetical protein